MKVTIVYDGECPVCRHIVGVARLRDRGGELDLINAREGNVSSVQGNDLSDVKFDEGFAVVVDGEVHLGAEAANVMSGLTQASGLGFRVFQWLVRSDRSSRFWYPVLRTGRVCLLWILRVPKIGDAR